MGASWLTTVIGGLAIVLTWLNQIFVEQGIPQTSKEWIAFAFGNIAGLIGVFSKSYNVSNSQHPGAPQVVPPPPGA
jgi:hypothetical protein